MKKILLIIVLSFLTINTDFAGDKSEIKWRSFEAGLAEAKKAKKKILIDVYTDWCKWCKKLDTVVYTDPKVVKYVNKQYIPVKINGESTAKVTFKSKKITETELTQGFGVSSFPTILFLEPNGDAIDKLGSYVPADQFLLIVQYIGDDLYKKMNWDDYIKKTGVAEKQAQ